MEDFTVCIALACVTARRMRALPSENDQIAYISSVRSVRNSGSRRTLFNHFVRAGEQCRRHVEAQRLRGAEINYQIKFRRLLNRDVGRLRAVQNFIYLFGGMSEKVWPIRPVGHQSARIGIFPAAIDSWQASGSCQDI